MRDASICGLGQAASNPLTSVMRYFPELFAEAGGMRPEAEGGTLSFSRREKVAAEQPDEGRPATIGDLAPTRRAS